MGAAALQGAPRFIVGGFWVTTRRALAAAGGLEPHTRSMRYDAAAVVGLVAAARAGVVLTLNGSAYRALPRTRFLGVALTYEALVAPWLFALAAFRREIVWRGRRYRIGRGGVILDG